MSPQSLPDMKQPQHPQQSRVWPTVSRMLRMFWSFPVVMGRAAIDVLNAVQTMVSSGPTKATYGYTGNV
jgi:hypothetical protein